MFKKMLLKSGGALASAALFMSVTMSLPTCRFILHQPKEPENFKARLSALKQKTK